MNEALIAAVAALGGVVLGFFIRWGEFRRETRLAVYKEYLRALVNLGRAADVSNSCANADSKSLRRAIEKFEQEAINLRLVRTRRIRKTSEVAEEFINESVRPLVEGTATRDPSLGSLEAQTLELARAIAVKAQRDISGFGLPI